MGLWEVVLVTSVTVIVFIIAFLIFYWFRTKKMLKQSQSHVPALVNELKPGMKVLCAGGLVATYESSDKDHTIAKVKLSDGSTIEVAFYSISNIIV